MAVKLGVNIDHIATLRQARRTTSPHYAELRGTLARQRRDPSSPNLIEAAMAAQRSGAGAIVAHLRQDRRHIQEQDLYDLKRRLKIPLHVEIAPTTEMVKIISKLSPRSVCLVPERSDEVTTQGGLDLNSPHAHQVIRAIKTLKARRIHVSLFVDPKAQAIREAKRLQADAVQLCAQNYARERKKGRRETLLEDLHVTGRLVHELGLELHLGHALDYANVAPVALIPNISFLNIGFAIIARSVFVGLDEAVREMKELVSGGGDAQYAFAAADFEEN